jgi:hypothetical protein
MQEAVQVAQDVPTPRARSTISAASRERASAGQPHAFGLFCLAVFFGGERLH